jgi:hypothetical protein
MEEPVMAEAPQLGELTIICIAVAGVLLVTVTFNVSPGRTYRVGFSVPLGVMKQNKVLPAESVLVWYENLTFNTPLELKRLGGL